MHSDEYSTHPLPSHEQAEFWARTTSRFFGALEAEAGPGSGFPAELIAYQLDDLHVFRIRGPRHRVRRVRVMEDSPAADTYKLVLQVKGVGTVEQAGREIRLNPGEWAIYDPRAPYAITNAFDMEQLVVQIPRHPLRGFDLQEVQCPVTGRPDVDSMQMVFSSFLHSLSAQLDQLPDASANALAETTKGLLISTLAMRQDARRITSNAAVMRARVKQFVGAHLAEPDLSLDRIARELNCSKRYLHLIFEDEGVTLDRYIWNLRLERCHESLRKTRAGDCSISQIAFAWGFNSNPHFSRMFKARFGMTPRQCQMTS